MAPLQWVHARKSYDQRVLDPYTEWLLRAGRAAFDFREYPRVGGAEDASRGLRRVIHATRHGEVTPQSGKAATSADTGAPPIPRSGNMIWPGSEDENTRAWYSISVGTFDIDSNELPPFLGALGGKASAPQLPLTYAHLAPLGDAAIPETSDGTATYTLPDGVERSAASKKLVIVGVIDDAANIVHERLRDGNGVPRVDFAWIQDGDAPPSANDPVIFGREITRSDIAAALGQPTEDAALRELGFRDFTGDRAATLAQRFSHGTAVTDMAAGVDPRSNPDNEAALLRVISVQLPRGVTVESSGALYGLFAAAALRYIVARAKLIAKTVRQDCDPPIPLVLNFSYGLSGGPHNGEHPIECAIRQIVREFEPGRGEALGPVMVPMPVGNRFLLQGHAASCAVTTGPTTLSLRWVTRPQDRSSNYVELWLPVPETDADPDAAQLGLRLEPPGGPVCPADLMLDLDPCPPVASSVQEAYELRPVGDDETVLGRISVDRMSGQVIRSAGGGPPKVRVLIALAPTCPVSPGQPALPAGVWTVTATAWLKRKQRIEAWVQRDDTPPGYRRQGYGSYLELQKPPGEGTRDALTEYLVPLPEGAGVDRYGTLSGISTGDGIFRVGASRFDDHHMPSLYSGAGSLRMSRVDALAPGDRSRVTGGLLCATSLSGTAIPVNGTSVAAPIVARALCGHLRIPVNRGKTHDATARDFACLRLVNPPLPDTPAGKVLEDNKHLACFRGRNRVLDPTLFQDPHHARFGPAWVRGMPWGEAALSACDATAEAMPELAGPAADADRRTG